MKNIVNLLATAGVAVVVYSLLGRFIKGPTIGLGLISAAPTAGMLFGNSLMLLAILIKTLEK